mmetsp:Transcript_118868/g.341370  ORF Transcript_118868/g.341370 Transcript_118868/m.341370 type:complete len:256 (-) Transcript_118868:1352-2119(-)
MRRFGREDFPKRHCASKEGDMFFGIRAFFDNVHPDFTFIEKVQRMIILGNRHVRFEPSRVSGRLAAHRLARESPAEQVQEHVCLSRVLRPWRVIVEVCLKVLLPFVQGIPHERHGGGVHAHPNLEPPHRFTTSQRDAAFEAAVCANAAFERRLCGWVCVCPHPTAPTHSRAVDREPDAFGHGGVQLMVAAFLLELPLRVQDHGTNLVQIDEVGPTFFRQVCHLRVFVLLGKRQHRMTFGHVDAQVAHINIDLGIR